MNPNLYIARQPILSTKEGLFAYEMLYRDSNKSSNIKDDKEATVAVLSNILNKFGVKNLLGDKKAFIKADKNFLMHDVVFYIPKEYFVFSLKANMDLTDELKARVVELSELGYTFAINDALLCKEVLESFGSLLKFISYIKVDINTTEQNLNLLRDVKAEVIFTKVETHELYNKARKYDAKLIQGYFFAKPKLLEQEKFDPQNLRIVELCNMIMSDASIDEIVLMFEQNHAISLQLLKYVNSGLFHFRHTISSIQQVLTLMGRTPLAEWLMLMMYSTKSSQSEQESETALMQLLKSRTDLMVEVSKQLKDTQIRNLTSKVYFLGVLSLLDALFNVNIRRILDELNIDDEIKDAIVDGAGVLGEILLFAKSLENFNIKEVESFCQKYKIDTQRLEELSLDVIRSANEFELSREKAPKQSAEA
ncbi:MAG: HDOD domain-containing protein [Sulfurimonas sp.]|jgi:EAL and modified HD-GYP domain-containing signal transduction protein|nr:HDOD domain-containing protein [Sulfurimonas sp.]